MPFDQEAVGAVVIGRNEGRNLQVAIESVTHQVRRVVYVDSGSDDGSVERARTLSADVVVLDSGIPFTAARARNEGCGRLCGDHSLRFVQFMDGDCELNPGWMRTALAAMQSDAELAVVCGRRRERFPERSLFNTLIDREWDTPIGLAKACGGDALVRLSAFEDVGGFNPELIAGEEPEMCYRMRKAGWKIARLDAEMTLHDVNVRRFSQWWKRVRRGGYAFTEGAALHGREHEKYNVAETRRLVVWGFAIPAAAVMLTCLVGPGGLSLLLAYPLQVLRLGRREGLTSAFFLTIGKFAEFQGFLDYAWARVSRRKKKIIEYR